MAKISPLAARTLHNLLASHAEALEKKAPEANPLYVPLPKQTEDEIDDLTFTYADFSEGENNWGGNNWGDNSSDTASNNTASTTGTSAEDLWGNEGGISNTALMLSAWNDTTNEASPKEFITDLWFGTDAADTAPTKSSSPSGNTASHDRDGSEWHWESRKERVAKMEAYKSHRVQRWTPRELELFRYYGVFCGPGGDDRDHDRLLAARYMKGRALEYAERRRSQAKARFEAHSAQLARAWKEREKENVDNECPVTKPKQGRKRCWVSMTVDEV